MQQPNSAPASLASGPIFPAPKHVTFLTGSFNLSDAAIVVPAEPAAADLKLARFLTTELSDRWDVQPPTRRDGRGPAGGRAIVMGSIANPLVQDCCRRQGLKVAATDPVQEGYVLHIEPNLILIAGSDDAGAFYGLQSLRQLIAQEDSATVVPAVSVRDWPSKPFRGFKLYLPGHAHFAFFHRFVRDFVALYKFNKLIIEMGGSMRLDRHSEINAGWLEMCRDTNYSRRNYPPGPMEDVELNSSHQDVADGEIIEKAEVVELFGWVRDHYIEAIPELLSLTHSYYLLARHHDLAEVTPHKWPDTFCPQNPGSYDLLFDVLEEYLEVLKPRMVHIGHDEWFTAIDVCPRCTGKDWGDLYGQDVRKTAEFLSARGVRVALWGDMLLQEVRGDKPGDRVSSTGFHYRTPCGMTAAQVEKWIPKDILIFNWFWSGPKAEASEQHLDDFGMEQIYGNMEPNVPNLRERFRRQSILGGAPSSWAQTSEAVFGKDLLISLMGCAGAVWVGDAPPRSELSALVQARMRETRRRFQGRSLPSETDPVTPLDISLALNLGAREPTFQVDLSDLRQGELTAGRLTFDLKRAGDQRAVAAGVHGIQGNNPLPREAGPIAIGVDATSLIFLHAAALPATNKLGYRLIWDQAETADLLGVYQVVYEDNYVAVLPIRYGVHILEWNWGRSQAPTIPGMNYRSIGGSVCYLADDVRLGGDEQAPITFFAYEWRNPRLGRVIKEVRLSGTAGFRSAVYGFRNYIGDVIPNNAILLTAISYVKPR